MTAVCQYGGTSGYGRRSMPYAERLTELTELLGRASRPAGDADAGRGKSADIGSRLT